MTGREVRAARNRLWKEEIARDRLFHEVGIAESECRGDHEAIGRLYERQAAEITARRNVAVGKAYERFHEALRKINADYETEQQPLLLTT